MNVTAIEEALSLDAVRRLENCDCFEILLSIRQRPVGVRNGHPGAPARVSPRSRAACEWCCGVGDVPEIPSGLRRSSKRGMMPSRACPVSFSLS